MRIFCGAIGVSFLMSGAVLADTNGDCAQDANPELAIRACSAIIQDTRGSNAVAYFSRGRAYDKQGDRVKATDDFDAAIRLSPQFTNAYAGRGYVYLH